MAKNTKPTIAPPVETIPAETTATSPPVIAEAIATAAERLEATSLAADAIALLEATKPTASAATILISLGGYHHAARPTADGFNLKSDGLPGDCVVSSGSVGHVLSEARETFTVVSAETSGDVLRVKIAPRV